mgnify:FL=1
MSYENENGKPLLCHQNTREEMTTIELVIICLGCLMYVGLSFPDVQLVWVVSC